MPKKPISFAFTANDQTILCADKFGDVYSLPTIRDVAAEEAEAAAATAAAASSARVADKGANSLTVHSRRNLQALEDQRKTREDPNRDVPKDARPVFRHDLLLGHVSMLTAVAAATRTVSVDGGRPPSSHASRAPSPPVQQHTPLTRRFSMMRFRHASDPQLSAKAREQAHEQPPPVPTLPAAVVALSTAQAPSAAAAASMPCSTLPSRPVLQALPCPA